MRSGSYRRSANPKARRQRHIGTYSYGLLQLEYLEEQFAIASSAAQKFELKCQIAEARQRIEELGL